MKKHILTILAIGLIFGAMFASVQAVYADANADSGPEGCIAFTSASEFTVSLGPSKTWDGTIQYSTDGENWRYYTAGDVKAAAGSDDGYSIFFRGNGNSYISKGTIHTGDRSSFKLTGSEIACSGNIENLLDHMAVEGHTPPDMSNDAFAYLFRDCASLTEAPELPATDLADFCYYYMFQNCTNLTAAPELPATTLADYCYSYMFYGCSSLTVAPELPATTLAEACYYYMFQNCTNLTTAPVLPATTLAEICYHYMFSGCTNLTTAPELPATTLDIGCYAYMFYGCKSLSKAPELPATTLARTCYGAMFWGCSSLTVPPALPATTLADYCYWAMFRECTSLNIAPELPATTLAERCYVEMFYVCTSLTAAPELPAKTLAESCYSKMFYGCSSLTEAPELPATTLADYCYTEMFSTCTSLTAASELPAMTLAKSCYAQMFQDCKKLTKIPKLPATTLADYCYAAMFNRCASLTAAGELPATTLAEHCYDRMFSSCESLTDAPKLPATTLAEGCYAYMFENSTNLIVSPELPVTTLAEDCYSYMFYGCSSLTVAPELPATTLAKSCYSYMFYGCSSLSKAPVLPATTLAELCYPYMFYGCTNLTTAPELPATTLTGYCYHAMFSYCTSLSKAPELPATTLAEGCYSHMFHGCSSLTVPPALPATTLTVSCYEEMFESSGVKISEEKGIYDGVFYGIPYRIPKEGDGTDASQARVNMFVNTSGPFTGTPELNTTYYLSCWTGSGTKEAPYVISTKDEWNVLAELVGDGYSMEDLFFKLDKDIEVTEMVGTYEKPFSGSFDGDGHTLTFNADDAPELCAPFVYAKDASFKNLHIAGTIKTEEKFAAGLIGHFDGTVNVTNCRSSITIDSALKKVNGKPADGTHGGFIAAGEPNGDACFKGCIFDGKLLGPETDRCGGFVGWANPTPKDKPYIVEDCLFAPEELTLAPQEPTNPQVLFNFIRPKSEETEMTIQNSYYTENIDDNSQGKAARIVTVDQGITIAAKKTKEYDVSGITAFETGLAYEATSNGRVYYAGKDDKVTVTIQSVCDGVTANAGKLDRDGTTFTLTMPDENVTLTLNKGANHKWKFTGFTWTGDEDNGYTAAVANYECENDSAHKDTVTKVALDQKLTKPTCTTGGKTAFTAAVTATDSLDGKDHSESKDAIATNALGHGWGEVTYTWSTDNSEVKAEHACTRTDCGATEEETVAVTSEVTKPPTCVEKGETTYTPGEFKNKAFKAQAKTLEDVPATDHKWKDATCTEPRTCSVCNAKEGEALGHNWGAWTKLDENQHQRVCGNDPDHKETGDHAWDDGVVTKEPTTEEAGEKTFTCSICKAERTEVLPKKEEVDPITPTDDTADDTPVDDDIPVVNTAKIHTVGNFTKKQMKLVFPADKSVTNYRIQYRMAGKKAWKSDWSAGTDMYVIHGVKKSSLCEFRIAGYVKLADGTWIRGKWSKVSYRYMSAVPLKTIKADKKKITVTWTKDRKASGYQIQCSLKKNMAGARTITVNGASKTKCTIKGLKSGKRYYVKIRPVKAKSGKKYLGILTKAKTAKVK